MLSEATVLYIYWKLINTAIVSGCWTVSNFIDAFCKVYDPNFPVQSSNQL